MIKDQDELAKEQAKLIKELEKAEDVKTAVAVGSNLLWLLLLLL